MLAVHCVRLNCVTPADDDAAELAQLHRSGHASQIRKRPSRTVADKASRQVRVVTV